MSSWKTLKIRDIGTIVSGATPKTTEPSNWGGDIAWLTPADLSGYQHKYISKGSRTITQAGYDSCSTRMLPPGSVLFSSRAPIGYVAITTKPLCTNQGFKSVVPHEGILADFLYYQLMHLKPQIAELGSGTTFKEISATTLGEVSINVPPLEEQQRIVAKIEELFSEIDKAEETLRYTQEQLQVYRLSILKSLFSSYSSGSSCTFGSLMSEVRNGYGLKPSDSGDNSILTIGSVRPFHVNLDTCRFNNSPFSEKDLVKENDLLITRYNGSREFVGVCAVVPPLDKAYAYPDKLIKCVPIIRDRYHSLFLQYYVAQGEARKHIQSKIRTTSGQNGISGSDIKKTPIFLPSLEKQREIVQTIERHFRSCDVIEQSVTKGLLQAQSLRQSILKKAFEGKLV